MSNLFFLMIINSHYFDITTISQFLEFRDTHYLQIHKCKEEDIEMGIAYNPSGSILYRFFLSFILVPPVVIFPLMIIQILRK